MAHCWYSSLDTTAPTLDCEVWESYDGSIHPSVCPGTQQDARRNHNSIGRLFREDEESHHGCWVVQIEPEANERRVLLPTERPLLPLPPPPGDGGEK